jgi:hypothetical protein
MHRIRRRVFIAMIEGRRNELEGMDGGVMVEVRRVG